MGTKKFRKGKNVYNISLNKNVLNECEILL